MNAGEFLVHEARLLDTQQFEAWLELFSDDAIYWLPLERGQRDGDYTSSLVYDDRTLLGVRVQQARHPRAHAQVPLARTVHQIGNISILEESSDRLTVASTLVLIEWRNERQRVWGALVEHRLRRAGASFKIARKRIDLVNSEAELEGLSILF